MKVHWSQTAPTKSLPLKAQSLFHPFQPWPPNFYSMDFEAWQLDEMEVVPYLWISPGINSRIEYFEIHSTWKGRLQCFSTGPNSTAVSSSLDSVTSQNVVPRKLSVIILPRGTDAVGGVTVILRLFVCASWTFGTRWKGCSPVLQSGDVELEGQFVVPAIIRAYPEKWPLRLILKMRYTSDF